jgi:hypothetical protein
MRNTGYEQDVSGRAARNLASIATFAVAWRVSAVIEQERRAIAAARAEQERAATRAQRREDPPVLHAGRGSRRLGLREPTSLVLTLLALSWVVTAIAVMRPVAALGTVLAGVGFAVLLVCVWALLRSRA